MQFVLEQNNPAFPEMRILLATINMALLDACLKPNKTPPDPIAMDAHDFIWGERLETFLHYTNLDPEWFRKNLTEVMENRSDKTENHFTADQRRSFRMNRKIYAKNRDKIAELILLEDSDREDT